MSLGACAQAFTRNESLVRCPADRYNLAWMSTIETELLTIPEVAAILRVSRTSAYRYVATGGLPAHRIGGSIRVDRDELREVHRGRSGQPERTRMPDFTISVPHRSADEGLVDVAAHARRLGEDGPVMRELVISARLDGIAATAGQLIAHLEGLKPHERRAMLDQARAEVGLPSTADVEAVERAAAASEAGRVVAARYTGLTVCHGKTSAGLGMHRGPFVEPRRALPGECRGLVLQRARRAGASR